MRSTVSCEPLPVGVAETELGLAEVAGQDFEVLGAQVARSDCFSSASPLSNASAMRCRAAAASWPRAMQTTFPPTFAMRSSHSRQRKRPR